MDERFVEIDDGDTSWRFDRAFLQSKWACTWGRGCAGILPFPAPELGQGCCSVGAVFEAEDEARLISALAATLDPTRFQYHDDAAEQGIFGDEARTCTRVVEGACIFLNRPGYAGGAGCALHLAALGAGEPPRHWKPAVCWQLPIKVDWEARDDGGEVATVRPWSRGDWGDEGESMAWCCTEANGAYGGDRPVIDSLADEIEAITGTEVFVSLGRRLGQR